MCNQVALDFLSIYHGCGEVLAPAEEDAQSKASMWEFREWRGREEEEEAGG